MNDRLKSFWGRLAAAAAALALAGLACGGSDERQSATVEALSTSVSGTATQALVATEIVRVVATQTQAAVVNQEELTAAATEAIAESQGVIGAAATATAIAPIEAELAGYGIDPATGKTTWIHPPLTLQASGVNEFSYGNNFLGTLAIDFVIGSDITWNTQFGDSGCGLVLRSDGNEEAINEYGVVATRGANGHVLFVIQVDGEVFDYQDMYARGLDPVFSSANDTTNHLAVVAQGNVFAVYTNGTLVGQIVDDRYQRGFVAMTALANSGDATCIFNNTYLWRFNR